MKATYIRTDRKLKYGKTYTIGGFQYGCGNSKVWVVGVEGLFDAAAFEFDD